MSSDEPGSEWWRGFFSGVWVDAQKEAPSPTTAADADLIERLLRPTPGARLLDVPCGPCRHALELASRGYSVAGVDITKPLLDHAARLAGERGLSLDLHHGDMRDLPWTSEFDGAYCYWGSFGYFDDAGNERFVREVARALRPGGRFVIDTHVAEALLPQFQARGWMRMGEGIVLEEREYDHAAGRMNSEWTFIRGEERTTHRLSIRLYSYKELCALLSAAGFGDPEAYDPRGGTPFALGASRLCLVAAKRS